MGIAGVAWATFLCQGVSAILAVAVVIRRLTGIKTDGRFRFFDGSILKQILVVAIPSTLQQSFISIGNIIIQSVINDFGTSVIAGYSAAVKLNNLVITSLTTLGNGISNYTAQNIGAGKIDRIRSGFKASLKLVWLLCIPFALLYFTCGRWLLLLFLDNPTATAIKTGIVFLCILAPFYFIVSIKLMADGILRGAGIMNKFMISTFTDLILRVVLSIIFQRCSVLSVSGAPGRSAGAAELQSPSSFTAVNRNGILKTHLKHREAITSFSSFKATCLSSSYSYEYRR